MESEYMIEALQSELNYYKGVEKETREIIEQLHRGFVRPGDAVYIHPFDMAEILNNLEPSDIFLINPEFSHGIYIIRGIRYKQSPYMPQHTKNSSNFGK